MNIDHLFREVKIRNKIIPNRITAQPMEGNDSEAGSVSEHTLERYSRLAEGRWGVIIIEAVSITDDSLSRKNQLVVRKNNLDGYKYLVEAIKRKSPDTAVLIQITHSGGKSGKGFSTPVAVYPGQEGEKSLGTEDLDKIRDQFIEAAHLFESSGADGIDFKLCHGYLGCELLRPANIRNDKWGGSFENRTRMLREAVEGIKAGGKRRDYLLGSRISLYEGIRGGCGTGGPDGLTEDFTEMDKLVRLMNDLQMDYVNVSAGIPGLTSEITRPGKTSKLFYLHQFRYAQRVSRISGNLKVIGSAYSVLKEEGPVLADENISKGYTDFAGWGRQSLADPLLPEKLLTGEEVNWCETCSGCSKLMSMQNPVGCTVYDPHCRKLLRGGGNG